MSVYSGFATRQLEQQYNSLISLLILTLSKRLVKHYKEEQCNEKAFRGVFYRILSGLKIMENNKYVPPKFSENAKILYDTLQMIDQNYPDKFMQNSNGFDILHKQMDFIITPEKSEIPEPRKFTGMPPHPLKSIRNHFYSDYQSQNDTNTEGKNIQMPQNSVLKTSQFQVENFNEYLKPQPEQLDNKLTIQKIDNPMANNLTFADLQNTDKNDTLPKIEEKQQQQRFYIPSNVIDQIQKQVEVSLLEKYGQPPNKLKKRNKQKVKHRGQQHTFKQLLLEFDQEDQILNKTFHNGLKMDQNQNNYDPQLNHGRYKLVPLSEGNRTRPKFYSSGK